MFDSEIKLIHSLLLNTFKVADSKAEVQAALWRIPPVDDNEPPPPDSPVSLSSPGGSHTRSLQLLCNLENRGENMKRFVSAPV